VDLSENKLNLYVNKEEVQTLLGIFLSKKASLSKSISSLGGFTGNRAADRVLVLSEVLLSLMVWSLLWKTCPNHLRRLASDLLLVKSCTRIMP
ncbi:unnamed protein product, partial [Medioppia subpectinata]